MKTNSIFTSACRYCRYYSPEGRRGGMCQQFDVPVKSNWKACSLALPPFASTWERLQEIAIWEQSFSLDCSVTPQSIEASQSGTYISNWIVKE